MHDLLNLRDNVMGSVILERLRVESLIPCTIKVSGQGTFRTSPRGGVWNFSQWEETSGKTQEGGISAGFGTPQCAPCKSWSMWFGGASSLWTDLVPDKRQKIDARVVISAMSCGGGPTECCFSVALRHFVMSLFTTIDCHSIFRTCFLLSFKPKGYDLHGNCKSIWPNHDH